MPDDKELSVQELAAAGKLPSLKSFKVERVLAEFTDTKGVALLGTFESSESKAVVILNKKMFDTKNLEGLFSSDCTGLTLDFVNDVYSKYVSTVPPEHGAITVDIIYPATEKHIKKFETQKRVLVNETPELYKNVVEPYIKGIPPTRIQWVYNILEKKAEAERIIFEDPDPENGFVLLPDFKWDQSQMTQLYCLAIVHKRGVGSLRDLRAEHITLLENVRDKAAEAIEAKYGVPRRELRAFLHYHPSYYHLHVHFVHQAWQGAMALAGKAVLVDDILDNLKTFGSDFFQRKTLSYFVGQEEDLWRVLSIA